MRMLVGTTCLTIALAGTAGPTKAQTWVYEPDTPTVVSRPLATAPVQRTTTYRTIIPQSRGRAPIVREQVVTETFAATPVVRERPIARSADVEYRVVTRPAAVEERLVRRPLDVDYAYSPRATSAYALAPMSEPTVTVVPDRWSYRSWDNRRLVVDPVTGAVIEEWRY